METLAAIAALSALAQENRLEVFRILVEAGEGGLPAGQIAAALGIPANTLSFHLDRLRNAGLASQRRDGRSIIYSANYQAMEGLIGYLTRNCCSGRPLPRAAGKHQPAGQRAVRPAKREIA
jgi:DNA-binding transcriptional ArsR family regulator